VCTLAPSGKYGLPIVRDGYDSGSVVAMRPVSESICAILLYSVLANMLAGANGKMRVCGDAGLQFRVSRVRV